jgi:hypothetical protein
MEKQVRGGGVMLGASRGAAAAHSRCAAGRSDPEFNTAREVIDSSGSSARDSGTGRDTFLSARADVDDGGQQTVRPHLLMSARALINTAFEGDGQ